MLIQYLLLNLLMPKKQSSILPHSVVECFAIYLNTHVQHTDYVLFDLLEEHEDEFSLETFNQFVSSYLSFPYVYTPDLFSELHAFYEEKDLRVNKFPASYILITHKGDHLRDQLISLYYMSNYNRMAYFHVLLLDDKFNMGKFFTNVSTMFLQRLFVAQKTGEGLEIFSPKTISECYTKAEVAHLGMCDGYGNLTGSHIVWHETDYLNLEKCPINAPYENDAPFSIVNSAGKLVGGINERLFRVITKRMRLNTTIDAPRKGHLTFLERLGRFSNISLNRRGNRFIGISPAYLGEYAVQDDTLDYLYSNPIVLVVPVAIICPRWKLALHLLSFGLWILELVTLSLLILSYFLLTYPKLSRHNMQMLAFFGANLNMPLPLNSDFLKHRIIIVFTFIYGLHFATILQAKYAQLLSTNFIEHQISTIEEIALADMNIYTHRSEYHKQFKIFYHDDPLKLPVGYNIQEKEIEGTQWVNLMKRSILEKNIGVLDDYVQIKFIEKNFIIANESRLGLSYIPEIVLNRMLSLKLGVKQHIWKKVANKYVHRLHASGLLHKYYEDIMEGAQYAFNAPGENIPLNLDDFTIPSYVLLFGWTITTIVFLAETSYFVSHVYKN